MTTYNTVLLKGSLGSRHEEYVASGVCSPGHLLQRDSNNKVLKHNVYGGRSRMWAKEDALQGKTINDAYAIGDLVGVHQSLTNDEIQARLPAGAPAVVIGDRLISNGDGTLIKGQSNAELLFESVVPSTAVSGTNVETEFDQNYTIPANTLRAGDVLHIRGQAIATATNATDTLTIKVYIGGLTGTLIVSSGAVDVANNDICEFDITLVVRTVGATGTIVAAGWISLGVPGTATAKSFNLASTAIDTTAAQKISVSATWSTTNAGNSVRLDILQVEQERATAGSGGGETIAYAAAAVNNSAGVTETFIAVWAA